MSNSRTWFTRAAWIAQSPPTIWSRTSGSTGDKSQTGCILRWLSGLTTSSNWSLLARALRSSFGIVMCSSLSPTSPILIRFGRLRWARQAVISRSAPRQTKCLYTHWTRCSLLSWARDWATQLLSRRWSGLLTRSRSCQRLRTARLACGTFLAIEEIKGKMWI